MNQPLATTSYMLVHVEPQHCDRAGKAWSFFLLFRILHAH